MKASEEVCVTGMAWATALGDSLDVVYQRLLSGETGMEPVSAPGRLRNDLAAMAESVDLSLPPAERLATLTRRTVLRALSASGREEIDAAIPLVLGTSFGTYLDDDPPDKSAHDWADRIAQGMGLRLPPMVISTACSSGADAISVGAELIRAGVTDCCVCGGVDVLTWSKRISHSALGTLSPTTLRAFDERHDGTLFGEGAGFLVLENAKTERQAVALFRGGGSASDATSMTAPDTSGVAVRHAIERSLRDAGLAANQIDVINAHASGTPLNDETERAALTVVFGRAEKPIVFGTKGNLGHSLGATGALEAIALVLTLRAGRVPPIVGLEQPDKMFPLPLPRGRAMPCKVRYGMSLTLGFGGFDTSLIFEVCR